MNAYTTLCNVTELEAISTEWDALVARSENRQVTLSPVWQLAWWKTFGSSDQRELSTLAIHRNGRLVGLLPLLRRPYSEYGLSTKRIELLASGEDECCEIHSEYLGLIAERGEETFVVKQSVDAIRSDQRLRCHEILFPRMNGEGFLPQMLTCALREAGMFVELRCSNKSAWVSLPQTWDAYVETLSKKSRYLVRRSLRDMEDYFSEPLNLRIASTEEELADGMRYLAQLHQTRWQHDGKPGAFANREFSRFHERVVPQLFRRNELRLMWLEQRGNPIAAGYFLVNDKALQLYQTGRVVDLPETVRPGIALVALAIRYAIEHGFTEFDFLGGPMRYKRQLASKSRPLVDLHAYRLSVPVAARQLLRMGADLSRYARRRFKERFPEAENSPCVDPER